MSFEMSSDSAICFRCGKMYGKRRGFFSVSYATSHKGVGYMPICKECLISMYNQYLSQCNDTKLATRQMCRKLDLYWDENVYQSVSRKSGTRSLIVNYMTRINTSSYAGKSYDDTLSNEGTLWNFSLSHDAHDAKAQTVQQMESDDAEAEDTEFNEYMNELTSYPVTKDVIAFWGTGYTKQMYAELEQRRAYWVSRLSEDVDKDIELDVGTEAIIRQICSLELDINRDRAEGKSVEKSTKALNDLLGSANLKPVQKDKTSNKSDDEVPYGVWIRRFENEKPIPKPDPEFEDTDGIKKYILVWVYGHLMKMLGGGKKNSYSKLYEEEIEKLRVDKPEYANEEDDEEFLYDVFSDSGEYGEKEDSDAP